LDKLRPSINIIAVLYTSHRVAEPSFRGSQETARTTPVIGLGPWNARLALQVFHGPISIFSGDHERKPRVLPGALRP